MPTSVRGDALASADIEDAIHVRDHMLDLRDSAIEEQAWIRRNRPAAASVDQGLVGSYRFLLARLELLVGSAVADETRGHSAGAEIGMTVVGILQVTVAVANGDKSNLERLLRAAAELGRERG